jgi:site-specific recombinase XerD
VTRKGGPRKGTLEFRNGRYWARLTITERTGAGDVNTRKRVDLKTDNKSTAKRALAKLVAEYAAGNVPEPEAVRAHAGTIDSYATTWLESRKARGVASASYEATLYTRVWKPVLGQLPLRATGLVSLVREVLDQAACGKLLPPKRKNRKAEPQPYSRQSIVHIRAVAFRLFDSAWRDELIAENPVARVSVPDIEQVSKARAILTDEEIGALVRHPKVDGEIRLLVLLSRTVAGLRAGDLNSLDWTSFGPGFETCTFVRRKTRKKRPRPETHEVPEAVRPFLTAWHQGQGWPVAGPVFPVRKGERAGKARKRSNTSYADRLRRELLTAGVDRHELHYETATTLPVDFHSTRRAYATALVRSGASDRETMKLGGWSTAALITRYDEKDAIRAMPAAAVLRLKAPENRPAAGTVLVGVKYCTGTIANDLPGVSWCRSPDLNRGQRAYEARALTN